MDVEDYDDFDGHGWPSPYIDIYNDNLHRCKKDDWYQSESKGRLVKEINRVKNIGIQKIEEENKSRIVKKMKFNIKESTKLTVILCKLEAIYSAGDIVFSNDRTFRNPTSDNPKVVFIRTGFHPSDYRLAKFPKQYSAFVQKTTRDIIRYVNIYRFKSVAFFNAFSQDSEALAIAETALPLIKGLEDCDLTGIEKLYLITDTVSVYEEYIRTINQRIWEVSQDKLVKLENPLDQGEPCMTRKSLGIKNARCFTIENFLNETECSNLINLAEVAGFESIAWEYAPSYRNCKRVVIKHERLSNELWRRIKMKMKREDIEGIKPFGFGNQGIWVPKFVNPSIRFTRYQEGEHFKPHRDGGFVINDDLRSVFTVIVYLNSASFSGGETILYESKDAPSDNFGQEMEDRATNKSKEDFIQHFIHPFTGMAVIFNHDLLHEASPVTSPPPSTKYILRTDIMFERIDCKDLTSYKDYQDLVEYKESERYYRLSIEEQKRGNPAESTEYFIKALELQAKLSSLDQFAKHNPLEAQIQHNSQITVLSYELWLKIFLYFDKTTELGILARVCKYFKYISEDDVIWRQLFFHYFPLQKSSYLKMLRLDRSPSFENSFSFQWKITFKNHFTASTKFEIACLYVQFQHFYYHIANHCLAETPENYDTHESYNEFGDRGKTMESVGKIGTHLGRVQGHYWSAGSGYKEYLVGSEMHNSFYASHAQTYVPILRELSLQAADYMRPLESIDDEDRVGKIMRYFHIIPLRAAISWIFNCSYPVYLAIKSFPILFAVPLSSNCEIQAITTMFVRDLNVPHLLLQPTALLAMYATDFHSSIVIHFERADLVSVIPVFQLSVVKNHSFLLNFESMQDFDKLAMKIGTLLGSLGSDYHFQNILLSGIAGDTLENNFPDFSANLAKELQKIHAMDVVTLVNCESLVIDGAIIFSQQIGIKHSFYSRLEILSMIPYNPFSELYFSQ